MSRLKFLLLALTVSACEGPPPPVKDTWTYLSAPQCVTRCAPLPVAKFVPECSRKNREGYYCTGMLSPRDISEVCACGAPTEATQAQTVVEAPNLLAPVLLHHGLEYLRH